MKLAERDGRIRSDSVLNSTTKWLKDLGFITLVSRGLCFLICKLQSIPLHEVPRHVVGDSRDSAAEELCDPGTPCRASDAAQIEDLHAPDPVLVLRAQGESKDPRLHVPLRLPSAAFLGLSLLVSLPFKDCDFKM